MTFEEVLPQIKAGKKAICKTWNGGEKYIFEVNDEYNGEAVHPHFLIRTDEEPQLSVFEPNSCDILVDDWVIVDD